MGSGHVVPDGTAKAMDSPGAVALELVDHRPQSVAIAWSPR